MKIEMWKYVPGDNAIVICITEKHLNQDSNRRRLYPNKQGGRIVGTKMNQQVKKKWLAKLATTKKARNMMHNTTSDGYCCLGVLCTLFSEETGEGKWKGVNFYPYLRSPGHRNFLPAVVREWAGITVNQEITLSERNDNHAKFPIELIESL